MSIISSLPSLYLLSKFPAQIDLIGEGQLENFDDNIGNYDRYNRDIDSKHWFDRYVMPSNAILEVSFTISRGRKT